MQDSKLYQWLSKLSSQERNDFLRFVELRGGKNRKDLLRMLTALRAILDNGNDCTREEFYHHWMDGAPFDANLLRKRLTSLKKLLDDYLATVALLQDPIASTVYRMKALQQRGWTEFIVAEHQSATRLLAESEMDENHFGQMMQVEESYLSLALESARKHNLPVMQQQLDNIDLHFLLQKLRYACLAHNQDRILGTVHQMGLLQIVEAHLRANADHLPPLLRLYHLIYQLQRMPTDIALYEDLKSALTQHVDALPAHLARELYQLTINHCVARFNAGELIYATEIQAIYTSTLESELLMKQGRLDGGALKNMMAIVLLTGNLALAEALLAAYGPKLSPESDPACIPYNQALIHYHRGDFGKARKCCDALLRDARDAFIVADARVCMWRASFEMGDLVFCLGQYDVFRMYLSRAKSMSPAHIHGYQQFAKRFHAFLRILSKYADVQRRQRNIDLEKLLATLNAQPQTTYLRWLCLKIKETLLR